VHTAERPPQLNPQFTGTHCRCECLCLGCTCRANRHGDSAGGGLDVNLIPNAPPASNGKPPSSTTEMNDEHDGRFQTPPGAISGQGGLCEWEFIHMGRPNPHSVTAPAVDDTDKDDESVGPAPSSVNSMYNNCGPRSGDASPLTSSIVSMRMTWSGMGSFLTGHAGGAFQEPTERRP